RWYTVAKSDSPGASETIETNQTAGIYRWVVQSYSDGRWYTVAKSDSPGASETIETNQTAGIYRWVVQSY
ncbi:hypothetical protein CTI14_72050, partial [Methylobacterium radiotolerans]